MRVDASTWMHGCYAVAAAQFTELSHLGAAAVSLPLPTLGN